MWTATVRNGGKKEEVYSKTEKNRGGKNVSRVRSVYREVTLEVPDILPTGRTGIEDKNDS